MSIGTGTSIGSYQIIGHLGSGGMGVVYRAHDTKLKRDVAIKCLPQALANEPDRVARFQREAEVLASLNHPHIAAIYDLQEIGGQRFIVLELVDGETLAARLMHGRIRLTEAVEIARQIVDALEAAHDKGIVHRDLKPSNIHVRPDGHVKVLDFGLAKILEQVVPAQELADSPTMTGTGTVIGQALLGTAAYMSPEQARGQEASRSSDIWAFGCVLFEMIAGRPVFGGETATDILGSVVMREPDWAMLPRDTPLNIKRLLTRCLQKDRKRRLHHIADARLDLDEVVVADTPRRRALVPWVVAAGAIAVAVAGGVALYMRGGTPAALEQRVEISTPPARRFSLQSFAISPDGTKLAFVVAGESQPQLWWRSLDSVTARPLEGTQGARQPFWSPDSQSIGFFAESAVKRVDVASGVVRRLTDAPIGGGNGGTWNADGVILFNAGPSWPLYRISSSGQDRREVTRLDPPRQVNHSQPQFLPDGRHFLYYTNGSPDGRGVYVGTLDSFESMRLFDADGPPTFMPPDRLLAPQGGTTYVRRFDPSTLTISTNPVPVVQGAFTVSASLTGILAYRTPPASQSRAPDLLWADRAGKSGDPILSGQALSPELSPDGTRVAFFRVIDANYDIWVADVASRRVTRFTSSAEVEGFPTWSPDGRKILFTSKLGRELHWKLASGVGAESTVTTANEVVVGSDWSSNGFLLYQKGPVFKRDFFAQRLSSDVKREGDPIAIAANPDFDERDPKFSHDGRWIAYQSNETGRFEIYAVPFPSLDSKIPITSTGGLQVRWRQDDQELVYLGLDGAMMSVPITSSPDGKTLKIGTPVRLFQTNILALEPSVDINGHSYEMSARGDRFLMMEGGEGAINSPITLILNWKPPFP
jgi:Tol biopolymer transport system component